MKLIVLVGPPASGKTTWSKQYIEKNPKTLRWNNDEFTVMLKTFYKVPSEGVTTNLLEYMRDSLIDWCIIKDIDLIIDNTNLSKRHIRHFESNFVVHYDDVELVTQTFLDISKEECIKRDKKREEKTVGVSVIENMFQLIQKEGWL